MNVHNSVSGILFQIWINCGFISRLGKIIFYLTTVEPVLKDHFIGQKNVVCQDRWSLMTGLVILIFRSFCRKCVVCQDRLSLMAVVFQDRFDCIRWHSPVTMGGLKIEGPLYLQFKTIFYGWPCGVKLQEPLYMSYLLSLALCLTLSAELWDRYVGIMFIFARLSSTVCCLYVEWIISETVVQICLKTIAKCSLFGDYRWLYWANDSIMSKQVHAVR